VPDPRVRISIAVLRRLRGEGATVDEIAAVLRVHRTTVKRWCRRYEISTVNGRGGRIPRKQAWRRPEVEALYRMLYWDRGMTVLELAERSHISEEAMRLRFVALGIGRRPRGQVRGSIRR